MSASAPAPPTIVINTPGAPTSTISAPRTEPSPSQKERPQNPALVKQCYLCDEQNPGDFSPTTKYLETCLLCSRHFCPIHKSVNWDQVCNINHAEYYRECLERARQELIAQGKSNADADANRRALAEVLINEGIYPSLGEREKAIFTTSPVSETKMQELANFRSLDAALSGTSTQPKSQLIEEKDFVGADIAV
ncbi:uncharacterized protein Z520_04388 [Fonsecaea multimorphosa CBS 102226]|uniref:Uncharacterized protein n=1 Tax=Fonsecaea multimorphosa CBS 102226 TaxID=1442371 RepID=A0A0D2K1L4_9EURO|nr:uncharacterized protein Z520_04388 [Fonsecaea multimorphosa CBS 102226]KIX99752.1 hypothetical protein Z520_04388 [Fonsecaea multimorphosa CBS 102226]OAL26542.1 hypothetical protein AYO22_04153 [Fonsecaea multimorphosa]